MAPVTRRRQAQIDASSEAAEEITTPVTKSATRKNKKNQKLVLRGKEDEKKPDTESTLNKVKLFENDEMNKAEVATEEPTTAPTPAENGKKEEEEEEKEEESDDEAPEAVSTVKTATEIKNAAKATQKAAQEQAAAQKRKRQERDALLKKQAGERKKVETQRFGPSGDEGYDSDVSQEGQGPNDAVAARPVLAASRGRDGKVEIPAVLPVEFLTDSSSDESDEEEEGQGRRRHHSSSKPKRRKVATVERQLTRLDRGPRDATVGSAVYRVTQKVDERMAPKARKHSQRTKELLLKRNRTPVKPHGGFLSRR